MARRGSLDEVEEHPLIGKRYWVHVDDESLWIIGTVCKVFKGQVTFVRQHAPGGPTETQVVMDEAKLVGLTPVIDDDVNDPMETDDLVKLRDPREAAMLHVLRERYAADAIFTDIGPVLTVINPYQQVPTCKAASHVDDRYEAEDAAMPGKLGVTEVAKGWCGLTC